jgi:transposase
MGRPTKLTPEVQKRICDAIKAGNYYEAAAAYADVDYRTFRNWMERGEKAGSGIYFQFFQSVARAEAEAEVRIVAQWQQQIPENWAAARDFLARRHPERWGPKEKREVSGPEGGPIEHNHHMDLSSLTDEELAVLERVTGKLTNP